MGQRFQIIIKDRTNYYVYHNQWFYGGTAIHFTQQFLKALSTLNFKDAFLVVGRKKNMFRDTPVTFYRYFSSSNAEMKGNDNAEIMKYHKNWEEFIAGLDNNDGVLIIDKQKGYCFYNGDVDGRENPETTTHRCIDATQYFDGYYSVKQLSMGRVIQQYQIRQASEKNEPLPPITEEDRKDARKIKKILDYIDGQPFISSLSDFPFPKKKVRKQALRKDERVTKQGIKRKKTRK